MSYEQAMTAPIKCRGAGCQQGRCASPMKCSGMTPEADREVARIKASLPKYPIHLTSFAGPEPEETSVFASAGFWIGLAMALVMWSGLCIAVWEAFKR